MSPRYGGNNRARTCDPLLVRQMLSQLSYAPECVAFLTTCLLYHIAFDCGIIMSVVETVSKITEMTIIREHSSAGRASALQAEGHRFEPYCSHHDGPVAQLVRAPACHAGGRGFEPHPGRHHRIQPLLYASVAQLVEQGTENPRVVGSIPTGGTTCGFSSFGRAQPCQG